MSWAGELDHWVCLTSDSHCMGSAPFDKFKPATVRMENVCLTSGSCNMGSAPCEKFKPAMGLAVHGT